MSMDSRNGGPGGVIEIHLTEGVVTRIKEVAKRKRINFDNAVDMCYSTGLSKALELSESWFDNAKKIGSYNAIVQLRASKAEKTLELMNLRSKSVSYKFDGFEEFNRMMGSLISYTGKRAEAKRLQTLLAERGIIFDIGPGEIPELDELNQRYLFRKVRNGQD